MRVAVALAFICNYSSILFKIKKKSFDNLKEQ